MTYSKKEQTSLPCSPQPAMAYVPYQMNAESFDPETALCKGTLFPVLNKPFYGRCCNG